MSHPFQLLFFPLHFLTVAVHLLFSILLSVASGVTFVFLWGFVSSPIISTYLPWALKPNFKLLFYKSIASFPFVNSWWWIYSMPLFAWSVETCFWWCFLICHCPTTPQFLSIFSLSVSLYVTCHEVSVWLPLILIRVGILHI